jgi:outer membrane protein TolC
MKRVTLALLAALSLPGLATAQAFLPSDVEAQAALRAQPGVRAAAARIEAAAAESRALAVGSHEFVASATAQRRSVDDMARRYSEWEAEISRPIRLPGKARLDREIGASTRSVAELQFADAGHEAARRLLDRWMGWLRNAATAEEASVQQDLLDREHAALARQLDLGDAAQRDLDLLDAERALLAAQTIAARDAGIRARQLLVGEFPELGVPLRLPATPDPQPLPGGQEVWRTRIIEQSAEIGIADAEFHRLSAIAQRTRAERAPDPSVGIRVATERNSAERIVGLVFSVPLGLDYRSERAATDRARATAAGLDLTGVRRTVEQTAWAAVQSADSRLRQWQSHQRVLAAQDKATERTRRAWELGEASLAEFLLAQRNLRQARLGEMLARVDALEAALLVRIDAHELWHPDASAEVEAGHEAHEDHTALP